MVGGSRRGTLIRFTCPLSSAFRDRSDLPHRLGGQAQSTLSVTDRTPGTAICRKRAGYEL